MGSIVKGILQIGAMIVGYVVGGPLGAAIGAALINVGAAVLFPNKPKQTVLPSQAGRLNAQVDLNAFRKMVLGRTAMANDIRFEAWDDGDDPTYFYRVIALAAHKVNSIEELWFDNEQVWTSSGGVIGKYSPYLEVQTVLEGDSSNVIPITGTAWDSGCRLTGCAYLWLKYRVKPVNPDDSEEQSPFTASITSRITTIGNGMLLYDPRLDSTQGGSGSQRADNQSTRTFVSTTQHRNLALHILNYFLGWEINGKLSVGKGVPKENIDMASFIVAANACEEAISKASGGTEPRYVGAAIISEDDDSETVLSSLATGCSALITDAGGKISIKILVNDLSLPVASFTDDDFLDDYEWSPWRDLQGSHNIVRGRFVDASAESLYQMRDYPQVELASNDGIDRYMTLDLGVVESPSQAQRLAKQKLQRLQYPGVFTASMKLTALRAGIGDVVEITFSPLGWVDKLFRVTGQKINDSDGKFQMVFSEEHEDFYNWDNEDTAPVTPGEPQIFDPSKAPILNAIGGSKVRGRGAYSDLETYYPGDIVVWETSAGGDGRGYIRIGEGSTIGIDPSDTDFWAPVVERGEDGEDGGSGPPGPAASSAYLTNENCTVWAYADGPVVSYSPAQGDFKVFAGTVDISEHFDITVVNNPSTLSYTISDQHYSITGGFDDPGLLATTVTFRATGTTIYTGVVFDKVFTLSKIQGGYEIVDTLPGSNLFEGRMVYLTTDGKLYIWDNSLTAWKALIDTDSLIDVDQLTGQIDSTLIEDNAITTPKILAGAITAAKIGAGEVTAAKMAANSIATNSLQAGAVTAAKISVTSLSAIHATIGLLRTANTGARLEIESNQIRVYDGTGLVIRMGVW